MTAFRAELDHMIATWGEEWPSEVAEIYGYAGMADEAFEWMYRDAEACDGAGWAEAVLNPVYDKLQHDPRWQAFLERFRLAPEQLEQIELTLPDYLRAAG